MAIRKILRDGDPTLRKKSKPVAAINWRVLQLLDDLADTLLEADGIGLAAPQVGILKRVAVIDASDARIDDEDDEADGDDKANGDDEADGGDGGESDSVKHIVELINPEIVERSGEQTFFEGCLSNPGIFGDARRPARVVFRTLDREGRAVEYHANGIFAVACCHEIDHLDGLMFTDRVKGRLYTSEEVKQKRDELKSDRQGCKEAEGGSIELIEGSR
jgi:peptide deformylase